MGLDQDDAQMRTLVCYAGMIGLFIQLGAYSFFGVAPFRELTGVFGTMATGPFAVSALEKFNAKRKNDNTDPPDPDDTNRNESTQSNTQPDKQQSLNLMAVA